jgi:hypothetical protein
MATPPPDRSGSPVAVPQELNVAAEQIISLPCHTERRLAIRLHDWNRIKNQIKNIVKPFSWLSAVYSIFSGIAITAGFSIYPLYSTPNYPSWLLTVYIVTTIFSIFIVILLLVIERNQNIGTTTNIEDIITEMDTITSDFDDPPIP